MQLKVSYTDVRLCETNNTDILERTIFLKVSVCLTFQA